MAFSTHRTRIILGIIALILIVVLFMIVRKGSVVPEEAVVISTETNSPSPSPLTSIKPSPITHAEAPTVVASGLTIPWDLAFLPNGNILVTERPGNLVQIAPDGTKTSVKLPKPVPRGEGGLLGIVLHPNFTQNNFLYLYMTTQNSTEGTKNAVFRYTFIEGKLTQEKTIIANIPGAVYHDGGRMEFGPDGFLYITTGDATVPTIAQDLKSLGGKILRLTDEGGIPSDNPFGTAVYSYGHRNPQGLAWDSEGRLWSTEHGRSGATSGMDEVNLIEKGKNYGWPTIEGDKTKEGMEIPALHSGASTTWAPASALYYNGKLYFGGLLGESLYEGKVDGHHIENLVAHFKNTYGRLRTVRLGPDGMFYITTSNRDGRGKPTLDDDRIIKIDPRSL